MKIVINRCYGGFGLSEKAYELLGVPWDGFGHASGVARNDPHLVSVVEQLGDDANGRYAELAVVEIPDDVEWHIEDYDGMESIHENHESWG